jgi:hypothetical protein
MTRASDVDGARMYSPDGEFAGTFVDVLFHPSGQPLVVGAVVRPPAAMVVVGRPLTYVPLSDLRFTKGRVWLTADKLPKAGKAAGKLGHEPDLTIIWQHMPLLGPSGHEAGVIADFEFDPETGELLRLEADGGALSTTAYGRLDVPLDSIEGYRDGAVHLTTEGVDMDVTGGMAKAAAATVVTASAQVDAATEAVGDAVVKAGAVAGRAIKAVKDSHVAENAARSVGSTWRDSVRAFKDGMKEDE